MKISQFIVASRTWYEFHFIYCCISWHTGNVHPFYCEGPRFDSHCLPYKIVTKFDSQCLPYKIVTNPTPQISIYGSFYEEDYMIVSVVVFHLYCMVVSMVVSKWLLRSPMLCQTKTTITRQRRRLKLGRYLRCYLL